MELDESRLSDAARKVLSVLRRHTALAWPILKTQCEIMDRDAAELRAPDLPDLAPRLIEAVSRFTSAEQGATLRVQLAELIAASRPPVEEARASTRSTLTPPNVEGVPRQVLTVLAKYTVLAWPILEAHCGHAGVDPTRLTLADLRQLVPGLARALVRWTSAEKAQAATVELQGLLKT